MRGKLRKIGLDCLQFGLEYGKIALVAGDCDKSRRGGMADAADSKSVNGNIVRVQVPPPA